jgi:hypothetical protein
MSIALDVYSPIPKAWLLLVLGDPAEVLHAAVVSAAFLPLEHPATAAISIISDRIYTTIFFAFNIPSTSFRVPVKAYGLYYR